MTSQSNQSHILPSLQKRIILSLAENGPQTRNQVQKNVGSAYKNILYSFASLEKKDLIQGIGTKHHRGRDFPIFWLTFKGIITSLLEGASPESLFKHTKECLPNEVSTDRILITIESAKILGKKWNRHLYSLLSRKEELSSEDIVFLTIQFGMVEGISVVEGMKALKALIRLLKNYPKLNEEFKQASKDMDRAMQIIKEGVKP